MKQELVKKFLDADRDTVDIADELPCILVEGPDRVGKSTIAKALSDVVKLPLFKFADEAQIFKKGQNGALAFDFGLTGFIKQTGFRFISDRSYVSEWVYATAFDRKTDWDLLERIDSAHADIGTKILYLWSSTVPGEIDELVPQDKYWQVKSTYDKFCDWTRCEIVDYDVDRTSSFGFTAARTATDLYACLDLLRIVA